MSAFARRLAGLRQQLPRVPGRRVLLVGQPGAGKSTLADLLTGQQAEPRPQAGVQTDTTDWATDAEVVLWHRHGGHLVVDTPGLGTVRHPAEVLVRTMPFALFDVVLYVFRGKLHVADHMLLRHLYGKRTVRSGATLLVVRMAADELSEHERQAVIADLKRAAPVPSQAVWFCSARTGLGIQELRRHLGLGEDP